MCSTLQTTHIFLKATLIMMQKPLTSLKVTWPSEVFRVLWELWLDNFPSALRKNMGPWYCPANLESCFKAVSHNIPNPESMIWLFWIMSRWEWNYSWNSQPCITTVHDTSRVSSGLCKLLQGFSHFLDYHNRKWLTWISLFLYSFHVVIFLPIWQWCSTIIPT